MRSELDSLQGWTDAYDLQDMEVYIGPDVPTEIKTILLTSGKTLPVHLRFEAHEKPERYLRPTVTVEFDPAYGEGKEKALILTRLDNREETDPEDERLVRQRVLECPRRTRERLIANLRHLLGLDWTMPARHELVLGEFKELRLDDGVIKHGARVVAKPQEVSEHQLRAGASIGLRCYMLKLTEDHRRMEEALLRDDLLLYDRERLEIKAKAILSVMCELGTEACKY